MKKRIFTTTLLVLYGTLLSFSQEPEITFNGKTLYKMSPNDIAKELIGDFYIYRPSEDGVWFDPDDGTLGLVATADGFTLKGNFAQTIYPDRGTGNIDGTVTDEARYYDGVWYKGFYDNNSTWYLLTGFKRAVDVVRFSNSVWNGNETIEFDRNNNGAIVLQRNSDGVWYYRCSMGDFPFKRANDNSQIDAVVEAQTLENSGLPIEEWVLGLWKGIVTKEDRVEEISEFGLSQEEIEEQLKSYGEKKMYYLEITKDYLRYKFPCPLTDGQGNTIKTCNDISIQHKYTINEDDLYDYSICVGANEIAHIGKYNNGIYLTICDEISIYSVMLQRVTDLGEIDDDCEINIREANKNIGSDITDTQPSKRQDNICGLNGYEWVEGEWGNCNEYGDWAKVVVSPTSYWAIRSMDDEITEGMIAICSKDNYIQEGEMLALDKDNPLIGIDENNHQIYMIFGEYSTMYLQKLKNELGRCWKNILWVYGEWKTPADYHNIGRSSHIKITPFYYQTLKESSDKVDFSSATKKRYKPMKAEHKFLGNVICIDDLYLDTEKRIIYYVDGLDKKIYLEQTAEYTQIKYIFWAIASILGAVILLVLFLIIKKLIRLVSLLVIKIKNILSNIIKLISATLKRINFKRIFTIITIVFAIWGVSYMCSGEEEYYTDSSYEDEEDDDYSWVYGTWVLSVDGETHTVCFLENGVYTMNLRGYYGSTNETGSYTINARSIKLDSGDGYPSYIDIEGNRLKYSNGTYYRKR